jgi:hypothetical protein
MVDVGDAFNLWAFWASAAFAAPVLTQAFVAYARLPAVVKSAAVLATSAAGAHRLLALAAAGGGAMAVGAAEAAGAGVAGAEAAPSGIALTVMLAAHARLAMGLTSWMMHAFPGTLTLGEALLVAQGLALCFSEAVMVTAHRALPPVPGWLPAHVARQGLTDSARHIMGCRSTQEARVQNAFDDMARTIHESLWRASAATCSSRSLATC